MSATSRYRETFLAVRALLQEHDPHGLMAKYGGDRFDDQIYGYEATTILERLKNGPSSASVEDVLNGLASKHGRVVNAEASRNSAARIAIALGAL